MAAEKEQLDQDYDYYDDTFDDEEDGTRGPIRLVVLAIVVAAFFGVGWIAYKQGIQEGKSNVPILKAESGTLKETPSDTLPPPSSSREIFERPSSSAAAQPEQLLPPPETPIQAPATKSAEPPAAQTPPAVVAEAPAVTKPVEPPTPSAPPPEETAVAPAATAPPPPAADSSAASAIAAGAYLVQVASSRSAEEAQQIWSKLQEKNTDLLSAYQSDVQSVEISGKGTFHRLRFGPFASRDDAGRVCNALKSRKQDCIVVKP